MIPRIYIEGELRGVVRLGWLALDRRRFGSADEDLLEAIRALEAECRERWAGLPPSQIDGLAEARALYRRSGVDPTRTRPSSEALLRRVLKGGSLFEICNAVDAGNLLSLQELRPLGLYDRAAIAGDVVCRFGTSGEGYPGIRKDEIHLVGRLGLFDDSGPFGSPTSDSPRTAIGETSRNLLVVLYGLAEADPASLEAGLDRGAALFARHCGTIEVGRGLVD